AEIGRRGLPQGFGVDGLAVVQPPRSITGTRRRLESLDCGDLPIERRIDLLLDDRGRAALPIAGNTFGLRSAGERLDHRIAGRGHVAKLAHLPKGQVERPSGGKEATCSLRLLLSRVIVEVVRG